MISKTDFISMLMGERGANASKILAQHKTEFSIYSCNPSIVERVLNDNDKTEVVELILESNKREKDIEEIIFEKTYRKNDKTLLDRFFDAFDSAKTKERLFLLMGETGVGKTYLVEKRYPEIPVYACNSSTDPYSLCYYLADTDGSGLKPHETPFLKAVKGELKDNRIILDEFNELPHDTLMFIQGITDEKQSVVVGDKHIRISPQFKLLATMNPPSDTDERNSLGDALLGRSVGFILELEDDILISRLGITQSWLSEIRKLWTLIKANSFIDVRNLDYRDYQKFARYDFETQLKFKICQGDIRNIQDYKRLSATGEYQETIKKILVEQSKFKKGE
jgi:hypothetical protein